MKKIILNAMLIGSLCGAEPTGKAASPLKTTCPRLAKTHFEELFDQEKYLFAAEILNNCSAEQLNMTGGEYERYALKAQTKMQSLYGMQMSLVPPSFLNTLKQMGRAYGKTIALIVARMVLQQGAQYVAGIAIKGIDPTAHAERASAIEMGRTTGETGLFKYSLQVIGWLSKGIFNKASIWGKSTAKFFTTTGLWLGASYLESHGGGGEIEDLVGMDTFWNLVDTYAAQIQSEPERLAKIEVVKKEVATMSEIYQTLRKNQKFVEEQLARKGAS